MKEHIRTKCIPKIITAMIIVCMLVTMSSCTASYNSAEYTQPRPDIVWNIMSYEEYCTYIETVELHSHFISYENISYLGQFDGFQLASSSPTLQDYCYRITDCNGFQFSLFISSFLEDDTPTKVLDYTDAMQDMRTHPSGDFGFILRNGVKYAYQGGSLSSIRWRIGDVHFIVSDPVNGAFNDYPINGEKTLLSQLLSRNPADTDSALREFATHIPFHVPKLVIWIGVPLLIAAAGVSTFLLLRRKKKGTIPPTKVSDDYTEEIIYEN